jgi:hypothetical protein
MEIAPDAIKFDKVKGKFHSAVNVLGIAYRPDGSVAARFSDTMKLDLENKKALEAFKEQPLHYEDQFELAPGQYNLKVAFTAGGESFGKLQVPLSIEPYDGKQFVLSAVVLSNDIRRAADLASGLDAELLEGKKLLVTQGMQITPSATNRLKNTDLAGVYVEVYDPLLLVANPPDVGIQYRIVDRKTGQEKHDTGLMKVSGAHPGNPVIPVGLKLPVNGLTAGSYRLEVKAMDTGGHSTTVRSADFEVN